MLGIARYMARPNKDGLDYFSIDIDIFDDHKILLAQELVDPTGNNPSYRLILPYIAIRLLREIYKDGYYIEWNKDKCLTLSMQIGNGITLSLLDNFTNCLVESGFFNYNIYNSYGVLTSKGVQKRWYYVVKKLNRKNIIINSNYELLTFEKELCNNKNKETPKSSKETPKSSKETPSNEQVMPTINISSSSLYNKGINSNNSIDNTNSIDNDDEKEKSSKETPKSSKETPKSSKETPKSSKETPKSSKNNGVDIQGPELNGFHPVEYLVEVYFKSNSFSSTREQVAQTNHMDLDVLRDWAEAFNRYLISDGTTIKQKNDWPRHFRNWLNLQNKNLNPNNLFNEKSIENGQPKPKNTENGNIKGHQPFSMESAIEKSNILFSKNRNT